MRRKEDLRKRASTPKPGQVYEGMHELDNSIFDVYGGFTKVPNYLIDIEMPNLSISAIKCLMLVVRKTIGFQKKIDSISITQFCKLGNIKKEETARHAIHQLEAIGIIQSYSSPGKTNQYKLCSTPPNKRGNLQRGTQKKTISSQSNAIEKIQEPIRLIDESVVILDNEYKITGIKQIDDGHFEVELLDDQAQKFSTELTSAQLTSIRKGFHA